MGYGAKLRVRKVHPFFNSSEYVGLEFGRALVDSKELHRCIGEMLANKTTNGNSYSYILSWNSLLISNLGAMVLYLSQAVSTLRVLVRSNYSSFESYKPR